MSEGLVIPNADTLGTLGMLHARLPWVITDLGFVDPGGSHQDATWHHGLYLVVIGPFGASDDLSNTATPFAIAWCHSELERRHTNLDVDPATPYAIEACCSNHTGLEDNHSAHGSSVTTKRPASKQARLEVSPGHRDMSVEDAIELGLRSIYHATFRDAVSGGTVSGARRH